MEPISQTTPAARLGRLTAPQAAALKKLGLETARDLLLWLPFRYLDFSRIVPVRELRAGTAVSLRVKLTSIAATHGFGGKRMPRAEALVSDQTGSVKVVWYNQTYIAKQLKPGDELFLSGTPAFFGRQLHMVNPLFERAGDDPAHTARLLPVYHLTEGLAMKTVQRLVLAALPAAKLLPDEVPGNVRSAERLPTLEQAIRDLHVPKTFGGVALGRKRMAFAEIFVAQVATARRRAQLRASHDSVIPFNEPLVKSFVASLPFQLTDGQRLAAWSIFKDLEKPEPMNRLLEGDVGSGKTLVAFLAALEAVSAGYQVALLAPTEILARQHHESALKFFGKGSAATIQTVLVTQSISRVGNKDVDRDAVLRGTSTGVPGLYVGTHALLEAPVHFSKLALVVVDEQHRFGVAQRRAIVGKGGARPHLLSLSATPIPRTLQLAMFGELAVSRIEEKPAGRTNVATEIVANAETREAMYRNVETEAAAGGRIFVVVPAVDAGDELGVKSATDEVRVLAGRFPKLHVGLLHGRMKPKEKESAMANFAVGKTDVLVATTVVEVGVDVPEATVMVIEGAERFGLAQLHQLRGRVGRGARAGRCFACLSGEAPEESLERLAQFAKTHDGFKLAELDLKLRGSGDIFGQAQTGWGFRFFTGKDADLIPRARKHAEQLIAEDPTLERHPLLKNLTDDRDIHLE